MIKIIIMKANVTVFKISIVVKIWLKYSVRGATQNFLEFARNNMNTYFKS